MLPVSVRRANDVPGGFAIRDLTWTGRIGPNCAVRDSSDRFLSDEPGVANAAFREESVPKTTRHARRDSMQVRRRCQGRPAGLVSPRIVMTAARCTVLRRS